MPNYCSNTLIVTGPAETFTAFARSVRDGTERLSLERIIPEPDLTWAGSEYWYEWRICHWGTKWDLQDVEYKPLENGGLYSFLSAWSPPQPAVLEASRRWPELTFQLSYAEGGSDFAGQMLAKGGELLASRDAEYTAICSQLDGDWIMNGPLEESCAALPDRLEQQRSTLAQADTEADAELMARLLVLASIPAEIEKRLPGMEETSLWALATEAVRAGGGGVTLRVMRRSSDQRAREIATIADTIGRGAINGLFSHGDATLDWAGIVQQAETLRTQGLLGKWVETLQGLTDGWAGSATELLEASLNLTTHA